MRKEEYFSEMRKFSKCVWPVVERSVRSISTLNGMASLRFYAMLERRKDRPLLKPFLVKLAAEIAGVADEDTVIKLGAIVELLNISSYQYNSSFDHKGSVLTRSDGNEQVLAGIISREACINLLESVKDLSDNRRLRVVNLISKASAAISLGQYWDMYVLTWEGKAFSLGFKEFLPLYEERCRLLSGEFNRVCMEIGCVIGPYADEAWAALSSFGVNFGIMLQTINDIGDLVPLSESLDYSKDYQDQFSDITNGRLTLPIYLLLKRIGAEERADVLALAENFETSSYEERTALVALFVSSGAYEYSRRHAKRFAKRAKHALQDLGTGRARNLLSSALSVADTNKYYRELARYALSLTGARVPARGHNGRVRGFAAQGGYTPWQSC